MEAADWKVLSTSDGRIYYWNAKLQLNQWLRPACLEGVNVIPIVVSDRGSRSGSRPGSIIRSSTTDKRRSGTEGTPTARSEERERSLPGIRSSLFRGNRTGASEPTDSADSELLPDMPKETWYSLFELADVKRRGFLTRSDFFWFTYKIAGLAVTVGELDLACKIYGQSIFVDQTGFEQFWSADQKAQALQKIEPWAYGFHILPQEMEIRVVVASLFRAFDPNNTGVIDPKRMKAFQATLLAAEITDIISTEEFFDDLDIDEDNMLSFMDFIEWLLGSGYLRTTVSPPPVEILPDSLARLKLARVLARSCLLRSCGKVMPSLRKRMEMTCCQGVLEEIGDPGPLNWCCSRYGVWFAFVILLYWGCVAGLLYLRAMRTEAIDLLYSSKEACDRCLDLALRSPSILYEFYACESSYSFDPTQFPALGNWQTVYGVTEGFHGMEDNLLGQGELWEMNSIRNEMYGVLATSAFIYLLVVPLVMLGCCLFWGIGRTFCCPRKQRIRLSDPPYLPQFAWAAGFFFSPAVLYLANTVYMLELRNGCYASTVPPWLWYAITKAYVGIILAVLLLIACALVRLVAMLCCKTAPWLELLLKLCWLFVLLWTWVVTIMNLMVLGGSFDDPISLVFYIAAILGVVWAAPFLRDRPELFIQREVDDYPSKANSKATHRRVLSYQTPADAKRALPTSTPMPKLNSKGVLHQSPNSGLTHYHAHPNLLNALAQQQSPQTSPIAQQEPTTPQQQQPPGSPLKKSPSAMWEERHNRKPPTELELIGNNNNNNNNNNFISCGSSGNTGVLSSTSSVGISSSGLAGRCGCSSSSMGGGSISSCGASGDSNSDGGGGSSSSSGGSSSGSSSSSGSDSSGSNNSGSSGESSSSSNGGSGEAASSSSADENGRLLRNEAALARLRVPNQPTDLRGSGLLKGESPSFQWEKRAERRRSSKKNLGPTDETRSTSRKRSSGFSNLESSGLKRASSAGEGAGVKRFSGFSAEVAGKRVLDLFRRSNSGIISDLSKRNADTSFSTSLVDDSKSSERSSSLLPLPGASVATSFDAGILGLKPPPLEEKKHVASIASLARRDTTAPPSKPDPERSSGLTRQGSEGQLTEGTPAKKYVSFAAAAAARSGASPNGAQSGRRLPKFTDINSAIGNLTNSEAKHHRVMDSMDSEGETSDHASDFADATDVSMVASSMSRQLDSPTDESKHEKRMFGWNRTEQNEANHPEYSRTRNSELETPRFRTMSLATDKPFPVSAEPATTALTHFPKQQIFSTINGVRAVHDSLLLRDLLSIPQYVEYFRHFLARNHALENLSFLETIRIYSAAALNDPKELHDVAKRIWDEFLDPRAPHLVNLDFECSDRVEKSIKAGNVDSLLFETAMERVHKLLEADVYRRFAVTPENRQLVTDPDNVIFASYLSTRHRRVSFSVMQNREDRALLERIVSWGQQSNLFKTVKVGSKKLNACEGSALIEFLLNKSFADSRPAALAMAQRILEGGWLESVQERWMDFVDSDSPTNLYRVPDHKRLLEEFPAVSKLVTTKENAFGFVLWRGVIYNRFWACVSVEDAKIFVWQEDNKVPRCAINLKGATAVLETGGQEENVDDGFARRKTEAPVPHRWGQAYLRLFVLRQKKTELPPYEIVLLLEEASTREKWKKALQDAGVPVKAVHQENMPARGDTAVAEGQIVLDVPRSNHGDYTGSGARPEPGQLSRGQRISRPPEIRPKKNSITDPKRPARFRSASGTPVVSRFEYERAMEHQIDQLNEQLKTAGTEKQDLIKTKIEELQKRLVSSKQASEGLPEATSEPTSPNQESKTPMAWEEVPTNIAAGTTPPTAPSLTTASEDPSPQTPLIDPVATAAATNNSSSG